MAFAIKCQANIRLPEHVSISVIVMTKENNTVREVSTVLNIVCINSYLEGRMERTDNAIAARDE